MHVEATAKKLIEARTKQERERMFKSIPERDLLDLAYGLKEICYSYWTSEPTKARASAKALEQLHKFSQQEKIGAYAEWINGIAEITRGNLVPAIRRLDNSAELFLHLGIELEAGQTQVSKLYVLALLGHYDEAVECGRKTLKIFKKYKDDLSIGKILHNLGNLFFRREIYREAEKHQLLARKHFLKADDVKQVAMIEHSLAVTYSALNDFREAEKFYGKALLKAQEIGMIVTQAEIESSLGYLALFRGKLKEALKFLELSRRKYETLQMPHQTAIAELEIADVYLELNLAAEAVSIYETVVSKLHKLKLQGEEARARANFGRALAFLNQTQRARRELKKAARLFVLEKNRVGAATVKLNEANLELGLQNHQTVLRLSQEAEIFLKQTGNLRYLLTARWLQAEALKNLGESAKARQRLERVYRESIEQEQSNTAHLSQISLGSIAAGQKNYRQAEKHFSRAIRLIETLRAPLVAEEFRMAFLANKLAPYENLAKIYLAEGKIKQAFLTVEKARARSLVDNLSATVKSAGDENNLTSPKLTRKLAALREELNWFYSRLTRADYDDSESLQAAAKNREKQIADIMRQIASTGEAGLDRGDFLDFKQLQKQLGSRKALIEFVNFDGFLSAFVITDKKIHFAANLAKEKQIGELLESLAFQFGSLRFGAKNLGKFVDELKTRADFYLRKLYKTLIEPLENFIEMRDLVIVPVGGLYYVPFHALTSGEKYLIETREIAHIPSATIWQFLTVKPTGNYDNALLIGFADERIPLVNREIEALKKVFRRQKTFTGEQATFTAYTKNASHFDVIHFACHGQFRPENPLFSSLHLADGYVTVRDVCSQKLKANLVTLSACETGLNKIFAGDEILGLARGFLSAGAKSMILSLWTVNDKATAEFMKNFYKNIKNGEALAEALRDSQCNFIKRNMHPYFWSPFTLIGK